MARVPVAAALTLSLAASLAGLAACGTGEQRVAATTTDATAHPVVALGQARTILDSVDASLVQGAQVGTAAGFGARVIGPFREITLARQKEDAARKVRPVAPSAVDRVRLLVPISSSWPRFFVAVGSPSGQATYVLRLLQSPSPRSPYGLWAELTMPPAATLPEIAAATQGAALVAPDATGLMASPREVVAHYADLLTRGDASTWAKQFGRNTYTDQVLSTVATDRKHVAGVAEITSQHKPGTEGPFAIRTADGGALVIGELRQEYMVKVKKGGRSVNVGDAKLAALAGGKARFSSYFRRNAVEVIAFYVPPAGQGTITVVAAEKGDVSAVAK